ncbi:protein-S-isoprenylcysteine O-methyltransferase [Sporormia fimetaria CBS 119925]|uniref:Protein-S-isoprenylcysteine O-methyltransferase n=1 Tax=Sporormia fimetaria CBS 119925 TaxID=1340428 RepID=A0A6A6VNB7_9PLEO|nr:protein-S-isoprenylcysteine O-methyltransferase [Sporormia fimetaria CBS 119925]
MAHTDSSSPSPSTSPAEEAAHGTPSTSNGSFNVLPKEGRGAVPRAFFPGGDRSLSGIAVRAFFLGGGVVLGFGLTFLFALNHNHLWRPAFFVGTLCVFHFLEFWTTATYNTPIAYVSSYLLTNGNLYHQANGLAFFEALVTSYFFPDWQDKVNPPWAIALGLGMILVGQFVRSLAMCQAGTNFNHTVQQEKNEGHELVTSGLYTYFRHPSYFGFFWWGLGTQIVLGNSLSLALFALILWYFFKTRIAREEKHLVQFFGKDYEQYRARTRVWIPFIF